MGASFEVDEAAAIRTKTGSLSDTAWTKLAPPCAQTTATALAYALAKLQGIVEKPAKFGSVEDLSRIVESAQDDVPARLAIAAYAIKTRDRLSVVELERAFAKMPASPEKHRVAIVEAWCDCLSKVQGGVEQLQSSLEHAANRACGEKLLHPITVDKVLAVLDGLMGQTGSFSYTLGIEMDGKTIGREPEWGEIVGKFAGDVVTDAADGAQQVGGVIAGGAAALGEANGKGATDLGAAIAGGAQEIGKALENIDLGKVA